MGIVVMKKDWTILIYANGNNEFEPEMYQLLLDCRKIRPNKNINVVVQIGREKRELARILRPQNDIAESNENWTGVRRYSIKMDKKNNDRVQVVLIKDLGSVNMAHPKSLYDFLEWGLEAYSGERYMLIMGGHSFQYLGIMNDYSNNLPYIMGIPELAKALNLINHNTGKKIDIMVLDTCYMNMVEIIYELAKENNHTVKNILTYIEYGPIGGLPVNKLVNVVVENANLSEAKLLTQIIEQLDFDLTAFNLNKKKLEKIKRLTNDLAKTLLENGKTKYLKLVDVWENNDSNASWFQALNSLKRNLEGLTIHYKRVNNKKGYLLDIAHQETSNKLAAYYTRLSFAKNNNWTNLLGVELLKTDISLEITVQLKPIVLPLQAIISLISVMNSGASDKELETILHKLLVFKKWQKFSNVRIR